MRLLKPIGRPSLGGDLPIRMATPRRALQALVWGLCGWPLLASALGAADGSGQRVELDAPAGRIVSLAPHATELLFAIGAGDRIVGAVNHSDYPPEAEDIPRVGGYDAVDYERILALEPDLVVAWTSGNGQATVDKLRELGLTVYISEPRRLNDIATTMERLGRLVAKTDQGERAAAAFRRKHERLARRYRDRAALPVFYQVWGQPLMTVNGDHLISATLRLCGGRNVFAEASSSVVSVSTEAVLAANPEAVVASGMGRHRPEWLDRWRQWRELRAVERGNLFHIPPGLTQRATPRLLEGAQRLCRKLEKARSRRR